MRGHWLPSPAHGDSTRIFYKHLTSLQATGMATFVFLLGPDLLNLTSKRCDVSWPDRGLAHGRKTWKNEPNRRRHGCCARDLQAAIRG